LSSPAVGVDLGGTNVRVGIVGPGGKILAAVRSRVADPAPERVVSLICDRIRVALGKASVELDDVAGVGIGAAAQLRGESGVVAVSPNLGWREVPFGGMLASALGRPVRVVNDVEAITWAEVSFGSARGHQNALGVFVGTGVGGGLVLDGRLIRGATGMAVEIGHVKVRNEGGEPCGCGGRGCIEAYLGGANLTRRLQREAVSGTQSRFRRCARRRRNPAQSFRADTRRHGHGRLPDPPPLVGGGHEGAGARSRGGGPERRVRKPGERCRRHRGRDPGDAGRC
jgi:glucokinase